MKRILFFLFVLLFSMPSAVWAIENQDCLACHGDQAGGKFVDGAKFAVSVHGSASCTDCHADIKEVPHAAVAKVSCGNCHTDESEALKKSDHGKALKAGADEAKACLGCHGEAHAILAFGDKTGPAVKARISETCRNCHAEHVKTFSQTVHGKAVAAGDTKAPACTDCHGTHGIDLYTKDSSKLFWQNIPLTCGGCHKDIAKVFRASVHGKAVAAGKREAPVCNDCHGEHSIAAVSGADSKVSPAHITETCAQCHSAERITTKYNIPNYVISTYMESYHGLSVQRGSVTAANCASCHETHNILPDTDPDSSIYPGNLVKTCGKCHAGIGEKVAQGKVHSGPRSQFVEHATKVVRNFYIILIIIVVGGMVVHNILDLWKKLQAHYRHMQSLGLRLRMGRSERIQHFILMASFVGLAYSGFALKYPHAWWTMPFLGAEDWRGLAHRIAALAFMMLSAYHLWFMLFTVKGRWHLNEMRPRMIDLVQFGQTFAYYFGMRKEKPRPAFYGYIEKMEYWALVWGTVIMVVTGGILMKKELAWKYFSSGIFEAIAAVHYYEAVLACLAIIVWHLYFVIFDPDVYPMKSTWISGKMDPSDEERTGEENPPSSRQ